ncbi:MAG: 50S ribosome-binding GTPase [Planctomycetaceae bacterium]|jgi:tRNA modification GTPase|nr:50S ribosome-binding GTPase [Planctomycetaceae bacterium]
MQTGFNETIIALASARGSSARSVVRISGKNSLRVLCGLFEPLMDGDSDRDSDSDVEVCEAVNFVRSVMLSGNADLLSGGQIDNLNFKLPSSCICDGNLIFWGDQRKIPAAIYYWSEGHGYTGEESVEVHTLGSMPIVEAFIDFVCATGLVRLANAGEFTLRAFLNGRIDLTQAEAVLGVIDAGSKKSLENALQQLAGGIAIPIANLRTNLFDTLVQLEAGFDFADEDIEFISINNVQKIVADSITQIKQLQQKIDSRGLTDELPKVILTGLPNAGKSSLFNQILKKNIAIVSDVAGTTRDYMEAEIQFNGIKITLIDSAGIDQKNKHENDPTKDPINDIAQNNSRRIIDFADVIIYCIESDKFDKLYQNFNQKNLNQQTTNQHNTNLDSEQIERFVSDQLLFELLGSDFRERLIIVVTKKDLGVELAADVLVELESLLGCGLILVSSITGEGIDQLCQTTANYIKQKHNTNQISTTTRCRNAIQAASDALKRITEMTIQDESLIASEMRLAINSLGLVDGTVHTEDILDKIFERFCIGK